uniref:Uncharacterized protein n=1 Tax=Oryza meridionalis TaxID=40149 RepID=A0A0E0EWV1_9ORYZ
MCLPGSLGRRRAAPSPPLAIPCRSHLSRVRRRAGVAVDRRRLLARARRRTVVVIQPHQPIVKLDVLKPSCFKASTVRLAFKTSPLTIYLLD